ncbi:uncharacterized protein [Amphiura filiformis]|uniref:uncharacterized protein isoform X1 n=1 Tax=Amphiura filiformis TaxID=82378 RepID=UPI003B2152E0
MVRSSIRRNSTSSEQCCFQLLGLSPGASKEAINQAYRRLARTHHPDKNNNDPQATRQFQEINNAYRTLIKSDEVRDKYQDEQKTEEKGHQRRWWNRRDRESESTYHSRNSQGAYSTVETNTQYCNIPMNRRRRSRVSQKGKRYRKVANTQITWWWQWFLFLLTGLNSRLFTIIQPLIIICVVIFGLIGILNYLKGH